MKKTRSKPTWRLILSKSTSDHIKYEVPPLKVKQSDRYETMVLSMYILVFGYLRRPKTALQESWSDEGTMEMVKRANACEDGRTRRCVKFWVDERTKTERGEKEETKVALRDSYATCPFSFVLIISYFISLNVTSLLRKTTTFLIHHRRFYPTRVVKE